MAAAKASQTGLMALWKRGWVEIPEVMGSSCLGVVGLVLAGIGVKNYYAKDGDNRMYKKAYTVYRSDDPRVKSIKQ